MEPRTLPKFRLPMLSQTGVYRAFEIAGEAMLPIRSGTVVVGRCVDNWATIPAATPCILVTRTEGILFRRIFQPTPGREFSLLADNPAVAPATMDLRNVLEIWEAKSYISSTFPIAELSLERVAGLVLDLQQQVQALKKQ